MQWFCSGVDLTMVFMVIMIISVKLRSPVNLALTPGLAESCDLRLSRSHNPEVAGSSPAPAKLTALALAPRPFLLLGPATNHRLKTILVWSSLGMSSHGHVCPASSALTMS
jgi:hypothetical protein